MPALLNQNPIEFTNNYKYLGVILDSSLSFSKFVTNIIKTTTHKAYVLSKILCYLNTQTCLSIYKSMVMPFFDYGDVLYAASNKSQLSKLQRLQNRCLRICTNSARRTNTAHLHHITKCNFLEDRRDAHLLNYIYKRRDDPDYQDTRDLNTRLHDGRTLKVTRPIKDIFTHSVGYRGAVAWNLLPREMKSINTNSKFKSKQKQLLRSKIPLE